MPEHYLLVKITNKSDDQASTAHWSRCIVAAAGRESATAFAIDVGSVVQLVERGSDHCAAEALRNGLALL